jgi:anti-sigma regulatory factor (Ser/Thr protein kinase)
METPEGNSRRSWSGPQRRPAQRTPAQRTPAQRTPAQRTPAQRGAGPRGTAVGTRATVLGSLTIPGRPDQVSSARAFVARTLSSNQVAADHDTATLLTSEIVTNAIEHTKSGVEGGTVTIVVIGLSRGVLVEIIDDGSAGTPVVKGDLYAAEGHGLFLVQHLAAQWGYLRDPAGTTVWFHLPTADQAPQAPERAAPQAGPRADRRAGINPDRTRPTQLWAAAVQSATAPA